MSRMAKVHVVYPSGDSFQYAVKGVGAAKSEAKKSITAGAAKIIVESYTGRVSMYWEKPSNDDLYRSPRHKYGAAHGRYTAKLSDDAVRQIRQRYLVCRERQAAIAKDFGVSVSTVNRAIHGVHWGHIE